MGGGSGLNGLGRAFNLRYRPQGPLKTFIYDRRMPIFDFGCRHRGHGGGQYMQQIVYEQPKRSWIGELGDFFVGLATAIPMFTDAFSMFSSKNQVDYTYLNEQVAPKPQGATTDDDAAQLDNLNKLAKLKNAVAIQDPKTKMFSVSTDSDGIQNVSYQDAQNWIFNLGKTKPKTVAEAKEKEKENDPKVNEGNDPKVNDGKDNGNESVDLTDNEPPEVRSEGAGSRRRTTRAGSEDEVTDIEEPEIPETDVDKSKPLTKVMNIQLQGTEGSATITMPDGQTFTAYVNRHSGGEYGNAHYAAIDELRTNLSNQLKNAGWTNVTLKLPSSYEKHKPLNKNGAVATKDEEVKDKEVQAKDKADGPKDPEAKKWTAEKKAAWTGTLKVYEIRIDNEGLYSNGGNAKTQTPDGHVYYAQTGKSLSYGRALADIKAQLLRMVQNDGWEKAKI